MAKSIANHVEILVTVIMIMTLIVLSALFGLPISLPSGMAAALFAAQALIPLLAIGLWVGREARAGRRAAPLRPILAVGCYAMMMIVHFNLKLWVPFVRPVTYDLAFWRIDQFAYPLVASCRALATLLARFVGQDSGFYVGSLPVMFYISLGYHGWTAPDVARKLFVSALILQALGAMSYYVMPAVGPFLYQDGTDPGLTGAQHSMYVAHQMAVAAGPRWLVANGQMTLFAGLGAMPSLHAASSSLFVWFAWRYGRILLPTYIPLYLYILVTAVASRWHYLVDIPAGIALAGLSIFLAYALDDVLIGKVSVRGERPAFARPAGAALSGVVDGAVAGDPLPAGLGRLFRAVRFFLAWIPLSHTKKRVSALK